MSSASNSPSSSRHRLLRAVRLLPGAVRVGRDGIEEIDPAAANSAAAVSIGEGEKVEKSALVEAEAEIRTLKSELRSAQSDLAVEKTAAKNLKAELEKLKASMESERAELHEKVERERAETKAQALAEGQEEGLAKGYTEGMTKAQTEVQNEYEQKFSGALDLLGQINGSLQDAREKLALAHAPQLVRLWQAMLARMLQVEVDLDPTTVERLLEVILKRVSDRERIIVYLNPADVEMIEGSKEHLIDSIRGVKIFEILSDDHVEKGSCLVETNLGIYDARWKTQMEQIADEVQGLLMESMVSDESAANG